MSHRMLSRGRPESSSSSSFWQCSPQAHCGLAADTTSITTRRDTAEDEWERLFDIDPAIDSCAELDRPISRKADSEKKGRAARQRHKHFWVSQHSTPSMTPRRCVFCDMSFSSSSYDMHRMTCHKRDAALISATQVFRAPKEDERSSEYSLATPCDEDSLLSRRTTDETLDPSIDEGGEPTPPPQDTSGGSISSRDTTSEALDEAASAAYNDAPPDNTIRQSPDQAATAAAPATQQQVSVDLVEAALDAHRRVDLATTEIDACADRHKQLAAELHNANLAYRRSSVKADAARINSGFGFKVIDDDADVRKAVSLSVTVRNRAKRRVDAQTEELARASARLARARAHLDGLITGMAPADRDMFQAKLQLDLKSSSTTTSTDARTASANGGTSRLKAAAYAPYSSQCDGTT